MLVFWYHNYKEKLIQASFQNQKEKCDMKTEVKIRLSSIEDVRNFVEVVRQYEGDIDLASGRYVVDAKSIMGIFSLDLMNPITLIAYGDSSEKILPSLKNYIVD